MRLDPLRAVQTRVSTIDMFKNPHYFSCLPFYTPKLSIIIFDRNLTQPSAGFRARSSVQTGSTTFGMLVQFSDWLLECGKRRVFFHGY